MSLVEKIVKKAVPIPDIEKYDRFLFVGPHSDDIEIGAGATAAKLADKGKKICFAICTDGRYGTVNNNLSPDELVAVRKDESIASAKYMGIDDVRFLGFCDGGFYREEDLETELAKIIGDFKPDCIFCPDPNVDSECHIDHLNAGMAAKHRACMAPYKNIMNAYGTDASDVKAIAFYYTASPNAYIKVGDYFKKQLFALENIFPSQFPKEGNDIKMLLKYVKLRYFCYGKKEAFRVLGAVHMHCMPEMGLK